MASASTAEVFVVLFIVFFAALRIANRGSGAVRPRRAPRRSRVAVLAVWTGIGVSIAGLGLATGDRGVAFGGLLVVGVNLVALWWSHRRAGR